MHYILSENLSRFYPCPETLWGNEIKSDRLVLNFKTAQYSGCGMGDISEF